MAKEWFKVGKYVVFLIFYVLIEVQSCTVSHVWILELETNVIRLRSAKLILRQHDPMFLELKSIWRLSIDDYIRNFFTMEIKEKRLAFSFPLETFWTILKRDSDRTFKSCIFFVCQLEQHAILYFFKLVCSFLCLGWVECNVFCFDIWVLHDLWITLSASFVHQVRCNTCQEEGSGSNSNLGFVHRLILL